MPRLGLPGSHPSGAHSWTPFPADWPNRFSDEAVAQYAQAVVVGDLFGPEVSTENLTFYRRALEDAQGASNVGLLRAADHPELLEVLTRCKGPLALDDLRVRLGEKAFWPLLGEYCRAETATAEGFVDLLLLHRPGAETEAYLATWFR